MLKAHEVHEVDRTLYLLCRWHEEQVIGMELGSLFSCQKFLEMDAISDKLNISI